MAKNKIDLSIIIVSYNTRELTEKCISSVLKSKGLECQIIVIDNGSNDSSVSMLSKLSNRNTNFELVKSSENLGFSKANNIGIKKSVGKYVLLLNSDTEINNADMLHEMVSWMEKNKKIGVSSCSLVNPDQSLQGTGGYFPSLLRVASWMTIQDLPLVDKFIKPFHPMKEKVVTDNSFYSQEKSLDWLTGAFFLIRRALIEDIGYLDEDYFMYTEEVDYCYRAKSKGWKIVYKPDWKVVHYGGASSTKEFAVLSEFKGVKTFYKKHYPSWQYPLLRLLLKLGAFWRIPVMGLLEGVGSAKIYFKAFIKA